MIEKEKLYRVSQLCEQVKKQKEENYRKNMRLIIDSGLRIETFEGSKLVKVWSNDPDSPPFDTWPATDRWYSKSMGKTVNGIEGLILTLTRSRRRA